MSGWEDGDEIKHLKSEVERLEAERLMTIATLLQLGGKVTRCEQALKAIADKAGKSECGGNYVAAISLIGDLEQMADAALEGEE